MTKLFLDLAPRVQPAVLVEAPLPRDDEYVQVDGAWKVRCGGCGKVYGIGDSPLCRDGHGRVPPAKGFEPYFDHGLGEHVTGWGDIHKAMRENNLDFRDHPSPGDSSVRMDKIREQQKRERERSAA